MAILFFIGLLWLGWHLTRNPKFMEMFNGWVDSIVQSIYASLRARREDPYSFVNLQRYISFMIRSEFSSQTLAGFNVRYSLDLACRRENDAEFKSAGMAEHRSQQALARAFHDEIFLPHFEKRKYVFGLESRTAEIFPTGKLEVAFRSPVLQIVEENGTLIIREVFHTTLNSEIFQKPPLRKNGCSIQLGYFHTNLFPDELVEENHAMLTDEQKAMVIADPRFRALEEMMAVAALKRRLDFLGRQSNQKHETQFYSIETERAGPCVRVRWKLNSSTPAGYMLVGFRNITGFTVDEWSEHENGTMIVDSYQDGEVVEKLQENLAHFYTFFLRSQQRHEDGSRRKCCPLRFQIAISTAEETEAISAALSRSEKKPVDPDREKMSKILKDLNLVMEFEDALEVMEKTLIAQVKAKNLPKDEEDRKIEFIRDTIRIQRLEYQP